MKKALVVDDTKNIRILLTTCLEVEGYEVSTACDGHHALSLIEAQKFDTVFLDIKMPEISGTEVLRRIRELGFTMPVIIMTAFATVKNAVECTKLGAVAYLQKPFTADKVRALIKELDSSKASCHSVEAYINSSKELIAYGSLDAAYDNLKKALAVEPSCGEVYMLIGRVHELRGDSDQAAKFYAAAKQFGNF